MKKTLLTLILAIFFISPEILKADDFSVSIGGIGISRPDYEGANETEFDILPLIDITVGKSLFLNTDKGLGIYFMKNRSLELGGSLGYYESREEADNIDLVGLGDIDEGFDGRIFATLFLNEYSLSFQVQSDLSGNHDGALFILGAGYSNRRHTDVDWDLKATIIFVDDNYMQAYFGITSAQSTQSGLTTHIVEGGVKNVGINAKFSREIDRHWSLKGVVGHKLLIGDASRSPLVNDVGSKHQFSFGAGLVYKF